MANQPAVVVEALRLANCIATKITIEGEAGCQALGTINLDFNLWDALRPALAECESVTIGGMTFTFELRDPTVPPGAGAPG